MLEPQPPDDPAPPPTLAEQIAFMEVGLRRATGRPRILITAILAMLREVEAGEAGEP